MEARSFTSEKRFSSARTQFEELIQNLQTQAALKSNHVDLENQIDQGQREVSRLLFIVVFPESVARIVALEGVEAVVVREWALNTVFGRWEVAENHYATNFWELENNDALRFSRLLEKRQVPFLGTHDLVAHIANLKGSAWDELSRDGARVRRCLEGYFASIPVPTIASLVLPYAAGVVLDDLAQPPSYAKPGRRLVLSQILEAIPASGIDPMRPRILRQFPASYQELIELSRNPDVESVRAKVGEVTKRLTDEIHKLSFVYEAVVSG